MADEVSSLGEDSSTDSVEALSLLCWADGASRCPAWVYDDPPETASNTVMQPSFKWQHGSRVLVQFASLNRLVVRLTEPDEPRRNVVFLRAFLYTYRNFCGPWHLLQKLFMRYQLVPPAGSHVTALQLTHFLHARRLPVQRAVCNVLNTWMLECPGDFSPGMLDEVTKFCAEDLAEDGHHAVAHRLSARVMEIVESHSASAKRAARGGSRGGAAGKGGSFLVGGAGSSFSGPSGPMGIGARVSRKMTLNLGTWDVMKKIIDYPVEEIATQWTAIQASDAYAVDPFELLVAGRNKKAEDHLRPHVLCSIVRFKKLNNWVPATVVAEANEAKRVEIVVKMVALIDQFLALDNFNGVAAVYAGLQSSSVHRLTSTFDALPAPTKARLAEIGELMKQDSNYKLLRRAIGKASGPCIPYLGIYVHDLVIMTEVHPTFSEEDPTLINFDKCQLMYNSIWEVVKHQQRLYTIAPNPELQIKIAALEEVPESTLYNQSLAIQPRTDKKKQNSSSAQYASPTTPQQQQQQQQQSNTPASPTTGPTLTRTVSGGAP